MAFATATSNVLRNAALLTKMFQQRMPAALHPASVSDAWMGVSGSEPGEVDFLTSFLRAAAESLQGRLHEVMDAPLLDAFTRHWVDVTTAASPLVQECFATQTATVGPLDNTSAAVTAAHLRRVDLTEAATEAATDNRLQRKRTREAGPADEDEAERDRTKHCEEAGELSRYQVGERPLLSADLRRSLQSVRWGLNGTGSLNAEVLYACSRLTFSDGTDDDAYLAGRDAIHARSATAVPPERRRRRRLLLPITSTLKALFPFLQMSRNTHRFFRHLQSHGCIVQTRANNAPTATGARITVEGLAEAVGTCAIFRKHIEGVEPILARVLPKLRAWEAGDDAALTVAAQAVPRFEFHTQPI
jgi:hypothetical protein